MVGSSSGISCIFILNLKRLPWLLPSDSTPIYPPPSSTSCLTMLRPRPTPSLLIRRVRCSLPNRMNSFSKSSFSMPLPVSRTCTTNYSALKQACMLTVPPFCENLSAFLTRLMSTYFKRRESPFRRLGMWPQEEGGDPGCSKRSYWLTARARSSGMSRSLTKV